MNRIFLLINLLLMIIVFSFNSCIIVKYDNKEEIEFEPEIDVSPKPIIELSNTMIRSSKGDMIAFLPKDWFLINVENQFSNDIIAVAVNKEYNMSVVFSTIRVEPEFENKIEEEGLYGLAWYAYNKREKKSAGNIKQIGKYQGIKMGIRKFVKYEYAIKNEAITSKSVVFISTTNDYYEFSLVPMSINGNKLPKTQEINDIFNSILTGIKF